VTSSPLPPDHRAGDAPSDRALPLRSRVSAALAPVAMIGGWTAAAALQPGAFDSVRETISALAAAPAAHPWVMTAGLAVTGVCHVVTASGLHAVPRAGRALLAVGGVATAAVAATPVTSFPQPHGAAAGVAFVALSVWPAFSWRRSDADGDRPVALRRGVALAAAAGLSGMLAWFLLELQQVTPTAGALTGLSERAVAGAQSLWPLVAVASLARRGSLRRTPAPPGPTGPPADRARLAPEGE
jgi:hypothetical membrane protein